MEILIATIQLLTILMTALLSAILISLIGIAVSLSRIARALEKKP